MTCKQMGGACEEQFSANSFEEMAEKSKTHGMEMFQTGDAAHLKVMEEMKGLMQDPGAMQRYMEEKKKAFDAWPED